MGAPEVIWVVLMTAIVVIHLVKAGEPRSPYSPVFAAVDQRDVERGGRAF